VLLTTQYLEEADQLAGRIVVIDLGVVIASSTPAELKARLGSDLIELEFLGVCDATPFAVYGLYVLVREAVRLRSQSPP